MKRCLADKLQDDYRVSERQACSVLKISHTVYRYIGHRPNQGPLRLRIKEIASVRVRYGYRRVHVLLRREGQGGES